MGDELAGRVALITGAGHGIGRATACKLAEAGALVVVADLDREAAAEAAELVAGIAWTGDVTADGAADALVTAAMGAAGRLDIIVNNAGAAVDAPVHRMTDEQFELMLALHLVAPFRILRAAAPYLRDRGATPDDGRATIHRKVVNVASVIGTMGAAGGANYAAGKSGLVGLTKSLAKEWGRHRVCVNAVAFGYIDTRLSSSLPEHIRSAALASIPLERFGTVDEAASAVQFLCSPGSDYVTGQILTVSGGATLGMTS